MMATVMSYARCSTDKQDLTAQKATLEKPGIAAERIYTALVHLELKSLRLQRVSQ